jgi:hypothetical protein
VNVPGRLGEQARLVWLRPVLRNVRPAPTAAGPQEGAHDDEPEEYRVGFGSTTGESRVSRERRWEMSTQFINVLSNAVPAFAASVVPAPLLTVSGAEADREKSTQLVLAGSKAVVGKARTSYLADIALRVFVDGHEVTYTSGEEPDELDDPAEPDGTRGTRRPTADLAPADPPVPTDPGRPADPADLEAGPTAAGRAGRTVPEQPASPEPVLHGIPRFEIPQALVIGYSEDMVGEQALRPLSALPDPEEPERPEPSGQRPDGADESPARTGRDTGTDAAARPPVSPADVPPAPVDTGGGDTAPATAEPEGPATATAPGSLDTLAYGGLAEDPAAPAGTGPGPLRRDTDPGQGHALSRIPVTLNAVDTTDAVAALHRALRDPERGIPAHTARHLLIEVAEQLGRGLRNRFRQMLVSWYETPDGRLMTTRGGDVSGQITVRTTLGTASFAGHLRLRLTPVPGSVEVRGFAEDVEIRDDLGSGLTVLEEQQFESTVAGTASYNASGFRAGGQHSRAVDDAHTHGVTGSAPMVALGLDAKRGGMVGKGAQRLNHTVLKSSDHQIRALAALRLTIDVVSSTHRLPRVDAQVAAEVGVPYRGGRGLRFLSEQWAAPGPMAITPQAPEWVRRTVLVDPAGHHLLGWGAPRPDLTLGVATMMPGAELVQDMLRALLERRETETGALGRLTAPVDRTAIDTELASFFSRPALEADLSEPMHGITRTIDVGGRDYLAAAKLFVRPRPFDRFGYDITVNQRQSTLDESTSAVESANGIALGAGAGIRADIHEGSGRLQFAASVEGGRTGARNDTLLTAGSSYRRTERSGRTDESAFDVAWMVWVRPAGGGPMAQLWLEGPGTVTMQALAPPQIGRLLEDPPLLALVRRLSRRVGLRATRGCSSGTAARAACTCSSACCPACWRRCRGCSPTSRPTPTRCCVNCRCWCGSCRRGRSRRIFRRCPPSTAGLSDCPRTAAGTRRCGSGCASGRRWASGASPPTRPSRSSTSPTAGRTPSPRPPPTPRAAWAAWPASTATSPRRPPPPRGTAAAAGRPPAAPATGGPCWAGPAAVPAWSTRRARRRTPPLVRARSPAAAAASAPAAPSAGAGPRWSARATSTSPA